VHRHRQTIADKDAVDIRISYNSMPLLAIGVPESSLANPPQPVIGSEILKNFVGIVGSFGLSVGAPSDSSKSNHRQKKSSHKKSTKGIRNLRKSFVPFCGKTTFGGKASVVANGIHLAAYTRTRSAADSGNADGLNRSKRGGIRATMITNALSPREITTNREHDLYFLDLALALAAKGEGQVEPNPLVGAVVVKNGMIVGQGFHRYEGVKHAEVLALEAAGQLAKGATVYVNLEPCCHRGGGKRTPPCCDALIAAQVKRVVCCTADPNPRVNGKGLAVLREAGIAVTVGPRISAARLLNSEYMRSMVVRNASPSQAAMELLF
jgi:pyrimidine deaminase RibD-like protein